MKRRTILKHLKKHGCVLLREGRRHSVYYNPRNDNTTAIPRHTEIADILAKEICKDLDIPLVT